MTMSTYSEFLRAHLKDGDSAMALLDHAVRKIPYGSIGERDPVKVIANNLGSCSGKHILLRDLLRETGHEAEIVTIFTYFNRGVPSHPAMPEDLRKMIEDEDICDFHHYVHARWDDRWLKLDATWHDALSPYGFPVNGDWRGQGDTMPLQRPSGSIPRLRIWRPGRRICSSS